ncbi:MAG: transcriptional activator NhaR [Pseudomonadota bacterium]|uniref:transcriptional activator NhaR n=1 Tax=Sulfuriferula sp. TaxID=2025307 RepID=UPI002730F380|nr:transcriptional activator NhaR [Sulfuriferula sp.]MDP2027476.1 transcriptional activator NhaR [Sulfuriferula sp.]
MSALNYKHLHYFWVVAKSGGVSKAAERLHLTPQSISGQLGVLEEALATQLFRRVGRTLELTDAGRMVLGYAEEIFVLGEELQEALRQQPASRSMQFRVGIADMVAKSVAYQLLEPAMRIDEKPRLQCREGRLDSLLGELAVHRLDLVIADRPMPSRLNVRGFSHMLGECGLTFLAAPALAAQHNGDFPQLLDGAPLLLPGEDAAVRPKLMRWLDAQRIRPRIVGEFDDSALLNAFGKEGAGIYAVPSTIAELIQTQAGSVLLGHTEAVTEQFYAISTERRLTHPAVLAISEAARLQMFSASV